MKRSKKKLLSRGAATGVLVLAIGLLAFAGIGTARAVLRSFSSTFKADLHTASLSVKLEQDPAEEITDKNAGMLLGKEYKDVLSAKNTSNVPEYIRVTIYKYWTNKKGEKCSVDPDLIKLHLVGVGTVWTEDTAAKLENKERTVLYCRNVVPRGGSVQFADTLMIDKEVRHLDKVTQTEDGNKTEIVTSYDYNGITFHIDMEVDAVQEHNAAAAIRSAWGVDASKLGIVIDPKN